MSAIERSASHLDATTSFPPRAERRRRPSTHLGTGAVLTVLAYLKHGWLGAGLFISFPVLFVASRTRAELREEDAQEFGQANLILRSASSEDEPHR